MSKDDFKVIGIFGFIIAIYPVAVMGLSWHFNIMQLMIFGSLLYLLIGFILFGVILAFIGSMKFEVKQSEIVKFRSVARLKIGYNYLLGTLFVTNLRLVFIVRRPYSRVISIDANDITDYSQFAIWWIFRGIKVYDGKEDRYLLVSNARRWFIEIRKLIKRDS